MSPTVTTETADEDRNRDERQDGEEDEAGAPHLVVFFKQPEKEKTQANDRPDDREVVQQQVAERLHGGDGRHQHQVAAQPRRHRPLPANDALGGADPRAVDQHARGTMCCLGLRHGCLGALGVGDIAGGGEAADFLCEDRSQFRVDVEDGNLRAG